MEDSASTSFAVRIRAVATLLTSIAALIGALTALITKTDTRKSKAAYDELKDRVETNQAAVARIEAAAEISSSKPSAIEMGALIVTPAPSAPSSISDLPTAKLAPLSGKLTPIVRVGTTKKEAPKGLRSFDDL